MKFKDFVRVYTNKKNKQIKFELKKKVLKKSDLKIKDIMNINIPLTKKLQKFEGI